MIEQVKTCHSSVSLVDISLHDICTIIVTTITTIIILIIMTCHSSVSLVNICLINITTIILIIMTCHSSVSLVTLPVDVVDSGPDPGGRELVGGRELEMLFLCLKIFGFGFLGTCIPS